MLTDFKSSGCVICGYRKCSQALDFHHVNGDKAFNPSMLGSWGYGKIKQELSKCIVVCANCHREIHAGQIEGYENVQRAVPVAEDPPLLRLINGS